jgi:hypothetical protein
MIMVCAWAVGNCSTSPSSSLDPDSTMPLRARHKMDACFYSRGCGCQHVSVLVMASLIMRVLAVTWLTLVWDLTTLQGRLYVRLIVCPPSSIVIRRVSLFRLVRECLETQQHGKVHQTGKGLASGPRWCTLGVTERVVPKPILTCHVYDVLTMPLRCPSIWSLSGPCTFVQVSHNFGASFRAHGDHRSTRVPPPLHPLFPPCKGPLFG